jgi:arabinose-5-phosphate isomerase
MTDKIVESGKETIRREAQAVSRLAERIGKPFADAVKVMSSCKGKVVVMGMGKSGIIGKKIAATFSSTGTPAFFLHPAEGVHGDIGLVGEGDVVIAVSKSGETEEVNRLIPALKRLAVVIIAIVGDLDSWLAKNADIAIDASVDAEACPNGLAPTCSTTAALAMGDAMAVSLLSLKEFSSDDFARLHPGGRLGKRLARVGEMMLTGTYVPIVRHDALMKEAILEMTSKRGITSVVDANGVLVGVITDGDLRRLLEKTSDIFALKCGEVMTRTPKTTSPDSLAATAVKTMEDYGITALVVLDGEKHPIGIVHLHDLMRAGVV